MSSKSMFVEDTDNIVITKYKRAHFPDFVQAGYYEHLHHYMEPNAAGFLKEFVYRKLLLTQKEITFVAYSKSEKKAVGSITGRRITDSLWGIWNIFVMPTYRGRRIAQMLITEIANHLKSKNVEKIISHVRKSNVPSIKHSQKSGWKSLGYSIFECERNHPIIEGSSQKIKIRKFHRDDKKQLFNVYERCMGKQWCSYLEINSENYLNRLFGPAFWEPYGRLSWLAMKKDVIVAESKGELKGYSLSRAIRFINEDYATHLVVPVTEDFHATCRKLLLKSFRPSKYTVKNKSSFVYVGRAESRMQIEKLGFNVEEFTVQGMLL
ncbi:GNAT family N-acetyltransferase [Candidatus Bathyarchaeota archaeon]|nr:GNAT family N-acetyltransferase [Candidatus Bathyarchaeota archaeon]